MQKNVLHVHDKNQVSGAIFGARIGLKYGKKYNNEFFKVTSNNKVGAAVTFCPESEPEPLELVGSGSQNKYRIIENKIGYLTLHYPYRGSGTLGVEPVMV